MTKLYVLDLNGTLTNTPFVDHAPLAILPGRKEKIAELQATGAICAIASNQGGVAFGFTTEEEATKEIAEIASELGIEEFEVAFGHPKPKWGYEKYATPEQLARRKPAPGMLLALMERCNVLPDQTIMIGDRDEDRDAAAAAGCGFIWSKDFFGSHEELLARTFEAFQRLTDIQSDALTLMLTKNGSGNIGYAGWDEDSSLVVWTALSFAPQAIEDYIKLRKEEIERQKKIMDKDFDPFLDADDLP